MKVVAIVQARTGSTRLPGKVLMEIAGKTMLEQVIARVRAAPSIDQVVIATTDLPADNAVAELARGDGCTVYRGSESDVLDRYYQAAKVFSADVVVRLTADCPLLDSDAIDTAIRGFLGAERQIDYLSNELPAPSFPRGVADVEVFKFAVLEQAWQEDHDPASREHVTPFIYGHPERFRLGGFSADQPYPDLRLTVDTEADLTLVRRVFAHFATRRFDWMDVVELLQSRPDLRDINAHVIQRCVGDTP